ncbi:MAG: hypothetical protein WAU68_02690 [Vitreimonas sp.]
MKLWLICAALFLGLAPLASAQPRDPLLSLTWYENEGLWRGVWVPDRPESRDGSFLANWTLIGHSDTERAAMVISITGSEVLVTRTGRNARCTYRGALAADRRSVVGTYSCNTAPSPMRWSASFGNQQEPTGLPSATGNDNLRFTWLEREGIWRGTWAPVDANAGDGHYQGRFSQPPNTGGFLADLMITAGPAGHFTVVRTQREGTCTYQGDLQFDGRTVSGFYTCDWHRDRLPWGAVIQLPRR